MGSKVLMQQLETRMGQCILTCPTAAAFSGIDSEDQISLGKHLRFFGDGYQTSKLMHTIDGRKKRYWRIPVMDGEFLTEETTGMVRAIGGGNFLILATSQANALQAAETAVEAMKTVPNPWRRGPLRL
jgi:formylmethanofuran--tetrahydromethanopterin N-formyltransferase